MRQAIIFANGNRSDISEVKNKMKPHDLVICADGGARAALKAGIVPNVIIGDFDSFYLSKQNFSKYKNIQCFKYPNRKDLSDIELSISYAIRNKINKIVVFGILGNRIDHLIANIFLMKSITEKFPKINLIIIEGKQLLYFFTKKIYIEGKAGDLISIIPWQDSLKGIKTQGLEYILVNGSLYFGTTKGTSNVMTQSSATVSIKKGSGLLIHTSI